MGPFGAGEWRSRPGHLLGLGSLQLAQTPPCPLQDIITALEERLRPLVQAELSVLVDVLHWPELLFLEGSEAYQRCESGGFLSK